MAQAEKWSLFNKSHIKETLQKSFAESDKRSLTADMQRQRQEGGDGGGSEGENDDILKASIQAAQAKEEEFEKRKAEVHQKIKDKLNQVEQEARHWDGLRREVESYENPWKKDVAEYRKKIEIVEKELKPLKQARDKKEKEFMEASRAYEEKSKYKNTLVNRMMEAVAESESAKIKRMTELSKNFEEVGVTVGGTQAQPQPQPQAQTQPAPAVPSPLPVPTE